MCDVRLPSRVRGKSSSKHVADSNRCELLSGIVFQLINVILSQFLTIVATAFVSLGLLAFCLLACFSLLFLWPMGQAQDASRLGPGPDYIWAWTRPRCIWAWSTPRCILSLGPGPGKQMGRANTWAGQTQTSKSLAFSAAHKINTRPDAPSIWLWSARSPRDGPWH